MGTPLRILFIEDSVSDMKLILNELRNGGYEPTHERVETEEGILAALEAGLWDLIISDYRLNEFSGPDALALVKKTGRDIPFVIVSGTIGEINAVEAMKAGATDYVMKDNLMRLAPAIRRELMDADERRDHRQADASLRESEERFRTMADSAPVLIWLTDADFKCTYVNKSMREFFNQSMDSIAGEGCMDCVHPADAAGVREQYAVAARARKLYEYELRLRRHDGEWRWMSASAAPRLHSDGSFAGYVGTYIDLTDRKRAEFDREAMREQNEHLLRERVDSALQQRAFLRDVLSSVTEGKLCLCDTTADLPPRLRASADQMKITASSLTVLRSATDGMARAAGMSTERTCDVVTAVNEAAMNAVVHAGGGEARLYADGDRVQIWIEDDGRGIDISHLPRATLERGYTTANSFGHGFFMILTCVDRMYLLTGSGGTTVVLEQQRLLPEPAWFIDAPRLERVSDTAIMRY